MMFKWLIILIINIYLGERSLAATNLNRSIQFCGNTLTWKYLVPGLSDLALECLDTNVSLKDLWDSKITNPELLSASFSSLELVPFLKKARTHCLSETEFLVPSKVELKRVLTLSEDLLTPWIDEQLKTRFPMTEIKVMNVRLPKMDCRSFSRYSLSSLSIEGKNTFRLSLRLDHQEMGLTGEFKLFQKIPVALKSYNVAEKIEAQNLEMQKREVTFSTGHVSRIEDLVGHTLNHPVSVGEPFPRGYVIQTKLVEKGQIVRLQFRGENFLLSSSGVADQAGALGDFIRIKTLDTQKVISGMVLDRGLVEVQ